MTWSSDHDAIAARLHAAGVAPTESAILAALRPSKPLDLDRELARGYLAGMERWGGTVHGGQGMLEGEEPETMRPHGRRS